MQRVGLRRGLAAQTLPLRPSAELSAEGAITAVVRGLQFNDVPRPDAGLARCFSFMDLACKKLVTGRGNVPEERTLETFVAYARASPKLRPLVGASSVQFGALQRIAGTATRGEIASMALRVRARANPLVHASGLVRGAVGREETVQTFIIRLQKQRATGEYLVTDLLDVAPAVLGAAAAKPPLEVPTNDAEAVRLYRPAAELGDPSAQWKLGLMYENGRGVAQSITEALRLILMAADRGSADAQLYMGVRYEHGRGVAQNNTEAARLYRLVADQGDAELAMAAKYKLAVMRRKGLIDEAKGDTDRMTSA